MNTCNFHIMKFISLVHFGPHNGTVKLYFSRFYHRVGVHDPYTQEGAGRPAV
jgi:hypothetical protein